MIVSKCCDATYHVIPCLSYFQAEGHKTIYGDTTNCNVCDKCGQACDVHYICECGSKDF